MAYSKTVWVDGSTPALDAAHLNNLENGVEDVDVRLTTAEADIVALTTATTTNNIDITDLQNNLTSISLIRSGTFSGTQSPTLSTTFNITNYTDYNWTVSVFQTSRTTSNGHALVLNGYIDVDGNTVRLVSTDDTVAVPARYVLIGIKKTMSNFAQVNF